MVDDVEYLKIHENIKYLTFGNEFNQNIKEYIPNSVAHLTFGDISINLLKNVFRIA